MITWIDFVLFSFIWQKINARILQYICTICTCELCKEGYGPSIKYVTLEGAEGVREGVTVCDRGGGQEHVTSCLYIFYHTYETWNLKWCLPFCCNKMYFDRRGNGQKPPRTKPSRQKTPDKNPREQLRENLYRGLLSGFFVLGLLQIGGWFRDVWRNLGVPGCVTKCDRGRRVKISQK